MYIGIQWLRKISTSQCKFSLDFVSMHRLTSIVYLQTCLHDKLPIVHKIGLNYGVL